MNNKGIGIGLFVVGLALTVTFSGRLMGSIPGIVFMIIGVFFLINGSRKKAD
jgi:hypothetical protein